MRGDFGFDLVLWQVAGDALLDLAALEEHEGWDAHHAVLHHDVGILVRVKFDDFDFAVPLTGELFDDRCDHLARLAPIRRKIYQNRGLRTDDFFLEVLFGYIFD